MNPQAPNDWNSHWIYMYMAMQAAAITDVVICVTDLSLAQYYHWHQFVLLSNEPLAHILPKNRKQTIVKHITVIEPWFTDTSIYHKLYLCISIQKLIYRN